MWNFDHSIVDSAGDPCTHVAMMSSDWIPGSPELAAAALREVPGVSRSRSSAVLDDAQLNHHNRNEDNRRSVSGGPNVFSPRELERLINVTPAWILPAPTHVPNSNATSSSSYQLVSMRQTPNGDLVPDRTTSIRPSSVFRGPLPSELTGIICSNPKLPLEFCADDVLPDPHHTGDDDDIPVR